MLVIVPDVMRAAIGGFIRNAMGHASTSGINLCSVFGAFIGSVVVLLVYYMIIRRRTI